ncbi:uncharacterized protein LOC133911265 [Phragmites australis]|uniref:uncharacterized protein LOC133911265 n=1 Tax=Phragmites australis TaxID=29695 RepID=UPI002D79D06A|nr:uncharacterized protein LOC133911265 [Phragmites australis]
MTFSECGHRLQPRRSRRVATASTHGRSGGQWRFPKEIHEPFAADVMFSFEGKTFWVDLLQGLVYCDWPTADGGSVVDFGFIDLPPGCPPDPRWTTPKFDPELLFSMTRDRTMGCVAGSIRFVCIDRSRRRGGVNVSVWTLDLATQLWTKDKEFRAKELWSQWSFQREGLPEMEPRFPVLMADGTLCLLLRNKPKRMEDPTEDYICNLDLGRMCVLWSGRLRQYHTDAHPVILPFNFFGKLYPLVPRKRELRGIFTQK